MILLSASSPLRHNLSRKLIDGFTCETHKLDNLCPSNSVTDEIDFNIKCSETKFSNTVLENLFPTDALSANWSNCCESNLSEPPAAKIAFFHNWRTRSFGSDKFCEDILLASVTSYKLRPESCTQIGVIKNIVLK